MSTSITGNSVRRSSWWLAAGVATAALAGGWYFTSQRPLPPAPADTGASAQPATGENHIQFPRESWGAAGIKTAVVLRAPLPQTLDLTGKIALDEDRVAHVFPLVEGRIEEVPVRFGDRVKKDQLLVVVHSREVGQAKLQLVQDRLQRDFAVKRNEWTQEISQNVMTMLALMRDDVAIERIERELKSLPIGEYRERLMSAYITRYRAEKQMERLAPLSTDGAVTGKQLLEAQAEVNAARAAQQSLLEQLQHEVPHTARESQQHLLELQTRVAVDETNLHILGFREADLKDLNPSVQGEAMSHYPIRAPFDGTIISKDAVLLERVGPERQILSIADLSTVWVTTDIYEEHLPLLKQLAGQSIRLRSKAWPGRTFDAKVFYTGDVVDETTRTIAMRAEADNAEGLLKPGMFVNVELPGGANEEVVQVPLSAVQEHEGKSFVFIPLDGDEFERRDVQLGRRNAEVVEIRGGLEPGEQIIISGGFVLKSKLLSGLLEE
jgi:cobalt-zinc-cadmium efflux system membrane fusion protein